MKFFLAVASLFASVISANIVHELKPIKAGSTLGRKVLSKARNVQENGRQLEDWAEQQSAWVANYSIKFQGCHHISQWNEEANDEEDVRIITKRLVRFRLCPSAYCSTDSTAGCANGYGDYIIDMNSYLEALVEAQELQQEYAEQNYNNNANGGYYDEDGNYVQGNENQQYQYQQEAQYDLSDYMECGQADLGNNRRHLEEYNNNNNNNNNQYDNQYGNNWDGNYYIGPYCASQGGAIYLGVFTDDSCTTFADNNGGRDTYSAMTSMSLPYGDSSLVDLDCIQCKEPSDDDNNNNNNQGDDAEDDDDVLELCENLYTKAGKCESNLPYGTTYTPNDSACNYMEGIKIVRKDGTVVTAEAKANKTAAVFIGVFVVGFILLSAYVYYLKTKLDRASINLSDE